MSVSVRVADSDGELLEAARIDLTAFGLPFARTPEARASLDRSLRWRRTTTTYLAELDGEAVGTARVYGMDLSTPGGMSVPASGIGDLGVLPGFRRRGVLRALMARMVDDARARGDVAAALYASEATIYGRFGFGPATRALRTRIPAGRARLRDDVTVADGRTEVIEPSEWLEVMRGIYERAMARRGGEVSRAGVIWEKVLCEGRDAATSTPGGTGDAPGADGRFVMVHRDPAGSPLAYALYSVRESWQPEGPAHSMRIDELVAVDVPAELALWRGLFSVGLVQSVEVWLPTDSPLYAALVDRWAPSASGLHDRLWLRLMDPVAALGARRYRGAGEAVLEVTGGGVDGSPLTVALSVRRPGAVADIRTAEAPADIVLGMAELAEVFLGGGSFTELASVGRVAEARAGEALRSDALFGWSPLPFVTHDF